jgi:flagellar assembly protein FliH
MAAADLLAARAIADDPALAVDAAVARVLSQAGFRTALHVHVHPQLVAPLRDLVAAREAAEQRQLAITIHDDASLVLGDARVLWDEGGLSLDAAARRRAVSEALGIDND